jgi:hypothetical protein
MLHRDLDGGRAQRADRELRHSFLPAAWTARIAHTASLAGVGTPASMPSYTTPPESHPTSSGLPRSRSCAIDDVMS